MVSARALVAWRAHSLLLRLLALDACRPTKMLLFTPSSAHAFFSCSCFFLQQGKKSFLEEGTPFQETIDGLLGLMPVGARNVTYLPAEAVAELQNGSEKEIHQLKGVQSWSHGPYLDDWSKVPAEIASQYNTSPTYGK